MYYSSGDYKTGGDSFSVDAQGTGTFRSHLCDTYVYSFIVAPAFDRDQCQRHVWILSGDWHYGAYRLTGYLKHCRCDQFHAKHRCYASFCQLWRNLHHVSDRGDGRSPQRVKECACGDLG